MKQWKKRMVQLFILLLFLSSLTLTLSKPIRNLVVRNRTNQYQLNKISRDTLQKNQKIKSSFNFDEIEPISSKSVFQSQITNAVLPVSGGIAIPELGINLPIYTGLNNDTVSFGAGTMKENQTMGQGNYALASHNVTGYIGDTRLLFTPLQQAKKGMVIYLSDKEYIYQYRIKEVTTVSPEHIEVLDDQPNKKEITLVTCADPGAINRIIVHGSFEEKIPYSSINENMKNAFAKSYNIFS